MPKDVLRSDLTLAAKLVFVVLASELYGRDTVSMTHAEIGACCHVGERQVRRSLQVLVAKGLVEQRRLSVGRVYQYRLMHREFGGRPKPQPPVFEGSVKVPVARPAAPTAMPRCAKCHLPRPRLHRSGLCRGCRQDIDLVAQVRAVRVELGADATLEQVVERMRQVSEQRGRRRLTARVRRLMEAAVA